VELVFVFPFLILLLLDAKVLNGEMKFDCVDCNAAVQASLEINRGHKLFHSSPSSSFQHNSHHTLHIKSSPHSEVR
jgi:hypothetical protein